MTMETRGSSTLNLRVGQYSLERIYCSVPGKLLHVSASSLGHTHSKCIGTEDSTKLPGKRSGVVNRSKQGRHFVFGVFADARVGCRHKGASTSHCLDRWERPSL